MGKWSDNKTAEAATDAVTPDAAVATEAKAAGQGRKVMIKNQATGEEIARVDLIKNLFSQGMKRGEIRKVLKEQYNHDVAYQIIFAATKETKKEPAAAPAAEQAAG